MNFNKQNGCGNTLNFILINSEISEKMDKKVWFLIQLWTWVDAKLNCILIDCEISGKMDIKVSISHTSVNLSERQGHPNLSNHRA